MEPKMFCYQCQETACCTGCTMAGVCGKKPDVAAMQDLLVYVTKGLSAVTTALRKQGEEIASEINHRITLNLFITITNANFDKDAIVACIRETLEIKRELLERVAQPDLLPEAAHWTADEAEFAAKAATVGILSTQDEDIRSLRELITYGLKGLSAYSKHANALLQDDGEVDAFLQRALAATLDDSLSVDALVALAMETGKYGVQGMALLDKANTETYGNPEITRVNIGVGTRRAFWCPATICVIWKCCSSRPQAQVWTYTRTRRCCPRIIIRRLRNIRILSAITATHGGNRKKSLHPSMVRF